MKIISVEKIVENLQIDVYPITIVKFLLNKKRILTYFEKAASKDFKIRGAKYLIDNTNCEYCNEKKSEGLSCRQHTSINRIIYAENVLFDIDTKAYFYKNEIYKIIDKRLVIIYCPHPKLITDPITDVKVRKINPITIEDPNFVEYPKYNKINEFISSKFLGEHMKCWFNEDFSIITIPEDNNYSNWCLVPNH